ncbi:endolytic transglycosylase MltG [Oenococcus oeni]
MQKKTKRTGTRRKNTRSKSQKSRRLRRIIIVLIILFLLIIFGTNFYNKMQENQLQEEYSAIDSKDNSYRVVVIKTGSSVQDMAKDLKKAGLVRTELDFSKYALDKGGSGLQAGTYYLQRSQSIPQIYSRLVKGPNTEVYRKLFIKKRVKYAQELQKKYKVLASTDLAQTILESDWGTSTLASKYNNYYGIKAQGSQKSIQLETKEYVNGKWVTEKDKFAVYSNWHDSMLAHAKFIANGTETNSTQFKDVLAAGDYSAAAKALVKDGYATDPDYANKLITLIKTYKLNQYDN